VARLVGVGAAVEEGVGGEVVGAVGGGGGGGASKGRRERSEEMERRRGWFRVESAGRVAVASVR